MPAPLPDACLPDAGTASPLPLPPAHWGPVQALELVRRSGLHDGEGLEVLGDLSAVVLADRDVVLKVHPPGTDPAYLGRVREAVAGCDAVLAPSAQVGLGAGGVVTAFRRLVPAELPDWATLGRLLRQLHDHPAPDLHPWVPLRRLPEQVAGLPTADRDLLLAAREALLAVPLAGTPGTVHGDVSPANCAADGDRLRLLDLDTVARGPREYDLAAALRRYRAGALDPEQWQGFCTAYGEGADVSEWPGLGLVEDLCELSGLGFVLWSSRRRGEPVQLSDAQRARWSAPAAR